jgi:hypothetical protein
MICCQEPEWLDNQRSRLVLEQAAPERHQLGLERVGQDSGARGRSEGDHVAQEAAHELGGLEAELAAPVAVLANAVGEAHAVVVERQDAGVGDGDAVGVAADVAQRLLGAREGGLGAHDGKYVVIQLDTVFAGKSSAVETVTPMLDPDGIWRVSGYYVK